MIFLFMSKLIWGMRRGSARKEVVMVFLGDLRGKRLLLMGRWLKMGRHEGGLLKVLRVFGVVGILF
jgi:hypothetical protein